MESDRDYLVNVESSSEPRKPFPKRVFFIIFSQFFERINFYGLGAILYVYLTDKLHYGPTSAAVHVSIFTMGVYTLCIFGGIVSDFWLGKFKTILTLSIIYAVGSVLVPIGTVPYFSNEFGNTFFYAGLVMISIGCGGMKPCVAAFGGDQFDLPEQSQQMDKFFSMLFFASHSGSVITKSITPLLKDKVHCFGQNDCYPLGFGLPASFMILALITLLIGAPTYTIAPPSENLLNKVFKCIWHGIAAKRRDGAIDVRDHFLDYSVEEYGQDLVNDTKCLLNLLVLFLTFPFFWTLYDQQGSLWVEQARHMDLNIGPFQVEAEQMQAMCPVLILTFIPLFDYCIYPLLSEIGIKRPLQKISIGGILAAFAFLLTAMVQWKIERSAPLAVSVLWQIPQLMTLAAADVMFSIQGGSFAFKQAPASMKTIVQACFALTVTFGNAFLAILSSTRFFRYQSTDYVLYEGLMLFDILIFILLAKRYKPIAIH